MESCLYIEEFHNVNYVKNERAMCKNRLEKSRYFD